MKNILLLSSGKAYLPEIEAYKKYLGNEEYQFIDSRELDVINFKEFDLIWKFMGTDFLKNTNVPVIHEYASLSTGRFAKAKNCIKKAFNIRPELRIFLNKNVKEEFNFNDGVPYVYRDMGVDDCFFIKNDNKNYDFVYVGEMSVERGITKILEKFAKDLNTQSLLMVGEPEKLIYEKYKNFKNIIFTGRVRYKEVPQIASQAEYAINYIPDKYPYNLQTSTKLLEYVAMNLKIVTTNYKWVNEFEKEKGTQFYKISQDIRELMPQNLKKFNFNITDISNMTWVKVLEETNLKANINKLIR